MGHKLVIIIETLIITVLLAAIVIYGQVVWKQYQDALQVRELTEQIEEDANNEQSESDPTGANITIPERIEYLESLNTVSEEETDRTEREALLEQLMSTQSE